MTSRGLPDPDPRFAPPQVPAFAATRPRLLALLDVAAHQRLTIVAAPPGYGKTTLLAQWAQAHPQRRVRWLRVGSDLETAGGFPAALRAALGIDAAAARVGPDPGLVADDVSPFVRTVLDALDHIPPTTLVIDDFHQLGDAAMLDELATLVDQAPQSLRTIIATRVDPPRRFYRLGLSEALVELRQDELAFTAREAAELVTAIAGVELDEPHLGQLVSRTEGWAAGLQLAALSLGEHADAGAFVAAFAVDDRHVADYLAEQVLGRLPDDVRRFLLTTSVLDRLHGSLCDAVTGGAGGEAMLESLHRQHLFTTPADGPDGWFRYHPLFRTLLRHHLADERPGAGADLLVRAGRWHVEHGDLDAGVAAFAEAGSWRDVLATATANGARLRVAGRSATVARWIALVPPEHRPDGPGTGLLQAACWAVSGEGGRALLAIRTLASDHAWGHPEQSAAGLVTTCALVGLGRPDEAVEAADRTTQLLDRVGGEVRDADLPHLLGLTNTVAHVRGGLEVLRGVALVHRRSLREGIEVLESVPDDLPTVWQVAGGAARALALAWCGRLADAEQAARWASRLSSDLGGEAEPVTVDAALALAAVALARGELARARDHLDEARRRTGSGGDHLTSVVLATQEALLALAEGQPVTGLTFLVADRTRRTRGRPELPEAVVAWQRAAEADLFVATGDLDAAARALEVAPVETVEVAAARASLALERGDRAAATAIVARWPDDPQPLAAATRRLWTSILRHHEGGAGAVEELAELVADAGAEHDLGLFRTRHVLGPARALYRLAPTPFLRAVVEQPLAGPARGTAKGLVEQLTERERIVLSLLPTRLSNLEIAATLGVSLNTVKTHVKHIYRKLGAADRSEAVATAERLHLF